MQQRKREREISIDKVSLNETINSEMDFKLSNSKKTNIDCLNSFLNLADSEIKKIFKAYLNKERELYLLVNSHLHIRKNYNSFDLSSMIKELNELFRISIYIMKLENYINLNLVALRKILKKFDKNFTTVFGKISFKYLSKKLDGNNSDLIYLIQFKIIDESSAIIESLFEEIKKKFLDAVKLARTDNKEIANKTKISDVGKTSIDLKQGLINDISNKNNNVSLEINNNTNRLSSTDLENIIKEFESITKEIEENILYIDNNSEDFKKSFESWSQIFKFKIKTPQQPISSQDKLTSKSKSKTQGSYSILEEDENVLDRNRDKNAFQAFHNEPDDINEEGNDRNKKDNRSQISDSTKITSFSTYYKYYYEEEFTSNQTNNLYFIYLSVFISQVCIYTCYSTIANNLFFNSNIDMFHLAWILSFTPLGSIIASFIFESFSYKIGITIPIFILAIGNLLYCFHGRDTHMIFVVFSRILIGLGSYINKQRSYLRRFIPDDQRESYINTYHIIKLFGIAIAFLLAMFCCFAELKETVLFGILYLNKYTISSFVCFFISITLGIMSLTYFKDPFSADFKVFKKDELNIGLLNNNCFEDESKDNYNKNNNSNTNIKTCLTLENELPTKNNSLSQENTLNNDKEENKNDNDDNKSVNSRNSRSYSYISRDTLTKKEIKMIDDIDNRLSKINEQSQFTDTNLVHKTIKQIAYYEKYTDSQIKKNFKLMLSIVIFSKVFLEILLILINLINWEITKERNKDLYHSMLIFLSTLITILVFIFIKRFYSVRELLEKQFLLVFQVLLIIVIIFSVVFWHFIDFLWICFFIMSFLNCLVENIACNILDKYVPIHYDLMFIKKHFVFCLLSEFGRFTGCLMIYLSYLVEKGRGEVLVMAVVLIVGCINIIIYSNKINDFKERAIIKLFNERKELREI